MDQSTSKKATVPAVTFSAWDAAVVDAYEAHRFGLMASAASICGRENAADIAQDVFIRVWSHPDAYDSTRSTLTHYLYIVTRATSIDRLRSATRQRERDDRDAALSSGETSVDLGSEMFARQLQENVRRALATLREHERDLIHAAYFGHMTYQQVAALMGLPEGTVKSRIRRAMFKLRVELETAA
jgi:RNA polymerase sigma-70 factor (ECF subfamily)